MDPRWQSGRRCASQLLDARPSARRRHDRHGRSRGPSRWRMPSTKPASKRAHSRKSNSCRRSCVIRCCDTAMASKRAGCRRLRAHGMEWADVYIGLRGASDAAIMGDIPAPALAANQRVQGEISTMRWQKTRWCLVRVPNAALARNAGFDLIELEEHVLRRLPAGLRISGFEMARDSEETARLTDRSHRRRRRDRPGVLGSWGASGSSSDGRINLPDGEIYTAPVCDSLNGRIHFESPGVFGGLRIEDIRLEWQDGALIHASASSKRRLPPAHPGDGRRRKQAGRVRIWPESAHQTLLSRYTL